MVLRALQGREHDAISDETLGEGYLLSVGPQHAPVRMAVFPETRSVEIYSGLSTLRLNHINTVSRRGQALRFDLIDGDEQLAVEMTPAGEFSLRRRPVAPRAAQPAPQEPPVPPKPEEQPAVTPTETPQRKETDRVTVRGRVGHAPRFRSTAKQNVMVGSFPLGEHVDLEKTVWHSIVVFGDRARKLQEKGVSVGQEIEIVGYPHERTIRTQNGSKVITEIYATAIRTTLQKQSQPEA